MLRRSTALAAVAVVSLVVGACSDANDGAGPTTTTIPTVSEVGLRRPWDGVVLPPDRGSPYDPTPADDLAELAALGAPNVGLVLPLVQDGPRGEPRQDPSTTPSDQALIRVLGEAADRDLGAVLQLRVEVGGDPSASPQPTDPSRWFERYGRLVEHYAGLAGDHEVALLVIGVPGGPLLTEADAWAGVLAGIRRAYDGPVSFATDVAVADQVTFWDRVDVVGVDIPAPPLGNGPDAVAGELEEAWEPVLARLTRLAERWSRPIVLTGVGFRASPADDPAGSGAGSPSGDDGDATDEPAIGRSDPRDPQGRGYQALFTVSNQTPAVEGVLVWRWGDDPAAGRDGAEAGYSPEGRPAEDVLRRAWTTPLPGDDPGSSGG